MHGLLKARPLRSMLKLVAGVPLALGALAFSTFEVSTAYLCQGQAAAGNPPRIGVSMHGTLYFSAQIDDRTASEFVVLAENPPKPIARVRINSGGGDVAAAQRMTEAIKPLVGIPMELPNIGTCQSACVDLLAHAPGPLRIAPEATIMFHAQASRIGLATCGPCGLNNRIMVWLSMHVPIWNRHRRRMLPWAGLLSDKLPVLFSLCRVNPLDTQTGMTLTGAELNGLRDRSIQPGQLLGRCPANGKP